MSTGSREAPTSTRPAQDSGDVAVLDIEHDVDELGRVRRWARAALPHLAPAVLADVLLVLGELVANALVHGAPPVRVRLVRRTGSLRLEVDDGGVLPARPRAGGLDGGRGLTLVAACTAGWGQLWRTKGKTVWAEISLSPATV